MTSRGDSSSNLQLLWVDVGSLAVLNRNDCLSRIDGADLYGEYNITLYSRVLLILVFTLCLWLNYVGADFYLKDIKYKLIDSS